MARMNRSLTMAPLMLLLGCQDPASTPLAPRFAKGGGAGPSVIYTAVGDIAGGPQALKGSNTATQIDADGDIVLVLNMGPLDCPQNPGSIPWEAGLVAFVQSASHSGSLSGVLDWHYEKQGGVAIHNNNWTTRIGDLSYTMQWYRETASHTEYADSTVIQYRNMAVMVFKKKGGKTVSREQCAGTTSVDADVTITK